MLSVETVSADERVFAGDRGEVYQPVVVAAHDEDGPRKRPQERGRFCGLSGHPRGWLEFIDEITGKDDPIEVRCRFRQPGEPGGVTVEV